MLNPAISRIKAAMKAAAQANGTAGTVKREPETAGTGDQSPAGQAVARGRFLGFADRVLLRSDAQGPPILLKAWQQAALAAGAAATACLMLAMVFAGLTGALATPKARMLADLERRDAEIRVALDLISQQLTNQQSSLFDAAAMERGLIFVDSTSIDIKTLMAENERLLSTLDAALSLTEAPNPLALGQDGTETDLATEASTDTALASATDTALASAKAAGLDRAATASTASPLVAADDLRVVTRELDLSRTKGDLLEAELLIERQTIAKMAQELSTARQENRALAREATRLGQSLDGRDDTIAVLKRDLISLQTGQTDGDAGRRRTLQLLNEENATLTAELSRVQDALDEARLSLKSMDARLSQSDADNLRLGALLDQREAQIVSLTEAQNDILDQLEAKVEEQMADLQKAIDLTGINQDTTLRLDSLIDSISSPFWNGMGGQIDDVDTEVMEFAISEDESTLRINGVLDRVLYIEKLSEELQMKREHFDALPTTSPVSGLRLSSAFGMRKHPISGKYRKHQGLDFAGPSGSPVMASASGRIVYAARKGTYGNLVEIDHGNGITTRYAHLRKISVKKGELVQVGQKVGEVGSTGASTGPHLHWEVRVFDQAKDPQPFLDAGRLF